MCYFSLCLCVNANAQCECGTGAVYVHVDTMMYIRHSASAVAYVAVGVIL